MLVRQVTAGDKTKREDDLVGEAAFIMSEENLEHQVKGLRFSPVVLN